MFRPQLTRCVAPTVWWPEDQSCVALDDQGCRAQRPRDSGADELFRASGEESEEERESDWIRLSPKR